jgi:hypothetical protein
MALEFVLETAAILVATAAVLVLFDWWFRLGVTARIILLELVLIGIVPFILIRGFRRWRASRVDDLSLAILLDRFRPGTGGRIADVLQLPDQLGQPATAVSPAMIRLAVKHATEALAESDWASLWNRGRTTKRSAALIIALLVPTLFATLAPNAARLSAGTNDQAQRGFDHRLARANSVRDAGPQCGPTERSTLAPWVVGTMAAANLSVGNWLRRPQAIAGSPR